MNKLQQKIRDNSDSIISCRASAQEIDQIEKSSRNRVAVLSSFTLKGIVPCLKAKAYHYDIFLDVYEGEYSQWRQEILGEKLYEFKPEIIFIIVDFFGMDEGFYFGNNQGKFDLKGIRDEYLEELFSYVEKLKSRTSAKIIISNNVKISPTASGVLEGKCDYGLHNTIDDFNRELGERTKKDRQVFIFDLNEWLGNNGKAEYWCDKYYYLGDMKLSPTILPRFAEECMSYIVPIFGKKRKCIVVDLDNTLWGGVIGEDGLHGIKLGKDNGGKSFHQFQKLLLSFKKQGILLAINSKNNESDVREVFLNHPDMVLKESDFVAMRINWEDKASNIKSIAEELNIGLQSIVFVDDDPTNRHLVSEVLPEVHVIDLPRDPSDYLKVFLEYKGLRTLEYTDEDRVRTEMYQSDKTRKSLELKAPDLNSFLESLCLTLCIQEVNESSILRSAQLTQKTNQFNLTTNRYQEEDIRMLIEGGHRLWTLQAKDRFGDYGTVGLCIVKDLQDCFEIDTLLLSCRVLGRKIEHEFLGHILKILKETPNKKVKARYRPTNKNMQVKDFYSLFNFSKVRTAPESDEWELDLLKLDFTPSNFVTILKN